MSHRRILAGLAAGVLATISALATAAPAVAVPAAVLAPGQRVSVIVVLRAQVDPATVAGPRSLNPSPPSANRARVQRRAALEAALRTRSSGTQRDLLALLSRRRAQGLVSAVSPLWIFNGIAVTAAPRVIRELAARPEVREVRPDVTVEAPAAPAPAATAAPAEPNLALVNAPALWDLGYRGQGTVVANLDTGVDATHPDLAGRWRGGSNSWFDPNGQHPTVPTDVNGHGTATMGVMVGGDAGGTSIGMAPDARWIAAKIFNDRGVATSTGIHRALQWLLDPDGNPATADAPDVVVNSWTMSSAGCATDFQLDLTNLRAAGILPVFAAGNYGPTAGTVFSPANNPQAFAVGATDNADVIDPSSSRGPSACGGTAPQLTAPGVAVHTTDLYGLYTDVSGTSLAAPHVAGALALLLSAVPDLPADRQAAALEGGAVDLGPGGPDNDYGYGRLDVLAAYQWLLGTPDFTVAASPSAASTSQGGTVAYPVNVTGMGGFTGDVTLSASAPAGISASVDPAVVAGGTGAATMTVTTAPAIAPGTYPITITGTSGSISHTAAATLTVTAPPDFGVAATPSSRGIVAGAAAGYSVAVSALNGFAGTVSLGLSGLPVAVGTASLAPASVSGAGTSQLTVTTVPTAPAGSYPLTITGTSGGTSRSATVTLVVTARDFGLGISPGSVTVIRRQTATYTVSVPSSTGLPGAVTLTVAGLPAGASATLSPNSLGAPGTSTLTVRTTGTTARGTFTLRVTGTSGSVVHQATATLIVR
jgi:subtilisin family serine protease